MAEVAACENTGTSSNYAQQSYLNATLYVGDLSDEVTEAVLFEKFSIAGPVLSIRVCRDLQTRRSLGYAYINFQQSADAERALDTMNFDALLGKPMRIMWSHRDPSLRKSGVGNIFIKNLAEDIDTKAIHDTFSAFGNILSCKVSIDEKGKSRGYGFVHFESEEAAKNAIERVNGKLLNGKRVFAGPFQPWYVREKEGGGRKFTNVYIKNIGCEMSEEKLRSMCEKFGEITSIYVPLVDEVSKKPKGFGFVAFKSPESAAECVAKLHGSEWEHAEGSKENEHGLEKDDEKKKGKEKQKVYAARAMKKAERQADICRKYEQWKNGRGERYTGTNIYVKNLSDTVDEGELEKYFSPYGQIRNVKIMRDDEGCSKGFGFVSYVDADIADKVITGLYGHHVHGKPLHVFVAERKEERRAKLAARYMQRLAQMRMNSGVPGQMYAPTVGGGFVAQGMTSRGTMMPQVGMTLQQMRMAPQQIGMTSQSMGMAPPQMGMMPQQIGITAVQMGMVSQQIGVAPQPMGMPSEQMSRVMQPPWSRVPMHKIQHGASPRIK